MNNAICFKQVLFSFFLLVLLSACGTPSSGTSSENPEAGRPVILNFVMPAESAGQLKTLNAVSAPIDSIEVIVRGDGRVLASKIVPASPGDLLTIQLEVLTGNNRTFFIIGKDKDGRVVLEGQSTVNILAGGEDLPVITIELKAIQVPVINPPEPVTLSSNNTDGLPKSNAAIQAFLSGATASDASGNAISEITNDAPERFPLGTTTVTFSARDADGNTGRATSTVTVTALTGKNVFPPAADVLAKFEFNGNLVDSSGNGRDASLIGGEFVPTNSGQGLHVFAGQTGIDWSAFASLLVHPYTIEFVLTPLDTIGFRKLFSFDDANDGGWYYRSQGFEAFPHGVVGGGQMVADRRHYIAFVSTAPNQGEIYFQGLLIGSSNASFTAPPLQAIFFRDDSATSRTEQLDAVVEALRISGTARTPQEIAAVQEGLSRTVADQAAPLITAPGSITIQAFNASGVVLSDASIQAFLNAASAIDDVDGVIDNITHDAPGVFPIGITTVTFSATDVAGNTGTATSTVTVTVPTASIEITPASASIVPFATSQFTAVFRDANGVILADAPFVWSSSDKGIASVDSNGLVTATNVGTVTITATTAGISGSADLSVTPLPLNHLAVRVLGLVKETDPIPGVRVLLHHPTTGAFITERRTDVNGVADFGDITLFGGITRATLTVQGAGLQTFVNILPEAYSVTLGPGAGNPAQATFDVQISGAPASASTVNVTPGHFQGDAGDRSRNGAVTAGSASLLGVNATALNPEGLFDLFAYALDFTSNSALVGCEFRDGLNPAVFPGTVNLTVSGPPTSIPFNSDVPVLTSMNFLRNGSVVEVFNQHPGAPGSLSGNIEFCDDSKITHYEVNVASPSTQLDPTEREISLIFDRTPNATDLNNIILPKLSIDSFTRDPATQAFNWTVSGLDITAIDLASIDLNWIDPLLGVINWEIFVVSTDGSGSAANPVGSLILPQLPLDPPGTINPLPAMPPATNVTFDLSLVGVESPGIGTVGYDATIELLNTNSFNVDKTVLTSSTQIIFAGRTGEGGATAAPLPSSAAKTISAGRTHSCALLSDGRVKCWGFNGSGALGNDTRSNSLIPVFVSGITTATSVSAGGNHSCAVLSDGKIKCWGGNAAGKLGNGTTTTALTPVFVSGITTATAVSAGANHSCAVLSDGRVQCWGDNISGQLGTGISGADSFTPVSVSGITNATAISVAGRHSCALLSDGAIKCWGDNNFGQLGNGSRLNISTSPVPVSGISTATSVSTGNNHSCASLSDGSIQCWGIGIVGQLGGGVATNVRSPVPVIGISNATMVSSKNDHSCALLADGRIQCWGDNFIGQLGNGTTVRSLNPVPVKGITTATAISTGGRLTCALLADGRIQCWGQNGSGRLGDGTLTGSLTPVQVIGFTPPQQALSAGNEHSCGLLPNGKIKCWGQNAIRQLGNNSTTPSTVPVLVNGITTATTVSGGFFHSCALLSNGRVKCWGDNRNGQLGNNSTTLPPEAVFVSGMTSARAVSVGTDYSCALLSDGGVQCWGGNFIGQLGHGEAPNSSTPVSVSGITSATAIAAGLSFHSCALLSDGRIKCWGNNSVGQLGNGSLQSPFKVPVFVSGITSATEVSVGGNHSCALLSDGKIQCWGSNGRGQLGNGDTGINALTPVLVIGITNATAISTGEFHSCALLAGGSIQCWGSNFSSQIGNGTTTGVFETPTPVNGITNATSVTAGGSHTCALLLDGSAKCWGFGGFGQLGNGLKVTFPNPVNVTNFPF